MSNTTPAPRSATCGLDAARKLARQLAGTTNTGTVAWDAALAIRALAADLVATRGERDGARADYDAAAGCIRILTADIDALRIELRAARATAPAPVPAAAAPPDVPPFLLRRVNGGQG